MRQASLAPAEASDSLPEPPASQAWNSVGSMTSIDPIIPECFVPQYSAQKR